MEQLFKKLGKSKKGVSMTKSEQDYLKAIYKLGGYEKMISNKALSDALHISPASVSDMVKRLVAQNYVSYERYHGIMLTKEGIQLATKVLRRHRIWEVFLMEYLGYDWHEVHKEAEALEHATSELLEKRLYAYLNAPQVCPHGSPIPDNQGQIFHKPACPLIEMKEGDRVYVERVIDDTELLCYLKSLNFRINELYTIQDIAPYQGPITLRADKRTIVVGREAAKHIFVTRGGTTT